jgi:hypothetical protein
MGMDNPHHILMDILYSSFYFPPGMSSINSSKADAFMTASCNSYKEKVLPPMSYRSLEFKVTVLVIPFYPQMAFDFI